jgi:hypothetical protein
MPKHVWSFGVRSDSGSGPVDSLNVSASTEVNIGKSGSASDVQIGANDVVLIDHLNLKAADIVSFFMEGDTDIRIRTNSEVSPSQEFNVVAKKAIGWNNADLPHGTTNPITVDITKLYIYNKNTVNGVAPSTPKTCNFQAGFLIEPESVYS